MISNNYSFIYISTEIRQATGKYTNDSCERQIERIERIEERIEREYREFPTDKEISENYACVMNACVFDERKAKKINLE